MCQQDALSPRDPPSHIQSFPNSVTDNAVYAGSPRIATNARKAPDTLSAPELNRTATTTSFTQTLENTSETPQSGTGKKASSRTHSTAQQQKEEQIRRELRKAKLDANSQLRQRATRWVERVAASYNLAARLRLISYAPERFESLSSGLRETLSCFLSRLLLFYVSHFESLSNVGRQAVGEWAQRFLDALLSVLDLEPGPVVESVAVALKHFYEEGQVVSSPRRSSTPPARSSHRRQVSQSSQGPVPRVALSPCVPPESEKRGPHSFVARSDPPGLGESLSPGGGAAHDASDDGPHDLPNDDTPQGALLPGELLNLQPWKLSLIGQCQRELDTVILAEMRAHQVRRVLSFSDTHGEHLTTNSNVAPIVQSDTIVVWGPFLCCGHLRSAFVCFSVTHPEILTQDRLRPWPARSHGAWGRLAPNLGSNSKEKGSAQIVSGMTRMIALPAPRCVTKRAKQNKARLSPRRYAEAVASEVTKNNVAHIHDFIPEDPSVILGHLAIVPAHDSPPPPAVTVVLRDLVIVLILKGHLDSRLFTFLERVAEALDMPPEALAMAVQDQLASALTQGSMKKTTAESQRVKNIRRLKVVGAAVGLGALTAVTAGLAAPAIAAGFGALGIAGMTGTATFLATAGGSATVASVFGAGTAGLTGWKYFRRIGKIKIFQFDRLQPCLGYSDHGPRTPICGTAHLAPCNSEDIQNLRMGNLLQTPSSLSSTSDLRLPVSEPLSRCTSDGRSGDSEDEEPPAHTTSQNEFDLHPFSKSYDGSNSAPPPISTSGVHSATAPQSLSNDWGRTLQPSRDESGNETGSGFATESDFSDEQQGLLLLPREFGEPAPSDPELTNRHRRKPYSPARSSDPSGSRHRSSSRGTSENVPAPGTTRFAVVPHTFPALTVTICVSGWLRSAADIWRPWCGLCSSYNETYALRWEPSALLDLGTFMLNILSQRFAVSAANLWLQTTVAGALTLALMWPIALIQYASGLDNAWVTCRERATQAGRLLAEAVTDQKTLGSRPLTLIGFSMGARVIQSCLLELARHNVRHRVANVILIGAPVSCDKGNWEKIRSVVSGRVINVYSRADWLLAFLFRYMEWGITVAGLSSVDVNGVENYDVTGIVHSHSQYADKIQSILAYVEHFAVPKQQFQHTEHHTTTGTTMSRSCPTLQGRSRNQQRPGSRDSRGLTFPDVGALEPLTPRQTTLPRAEKNGVLIEDNGNVDDNCDDIQFSDALSAHAASDNPVSSLLPSHP